MPSGAQVYIHNHRRIGLDVSIHPPEDDFGATEGLCGKFDGDTKNDLMYPDGRTDVRPNSNFQDNQFVEAWRSVNNRFNINPTSRPPQLSDHISP